MAITFPNCYTSFTEKELDLNEPVSEELVRKLVQNMNMMKRLVPVGAMKLMALNVAGTPVPDSSFFQRADGSSISNATSPFFTHNTPNLDGMYLRTAGAQGVNTLVGVVKNNLKHSHGTPVPVGPTYYGNTGTTCTVLALEDGSGGGDTSFQCHSHLVGFDSDLDRPVAPTYYTLGIYIKIT